MKNLLSTIVCLHIACFCSVAQDLPHDRTEILMEQLEIIHNADSLLLEYLPSSFDEYLVLWDSPDSPLYSKESVVEHLFHSQSIDRERFINKIVDLSVGAKPGVDHVYILKDVMSRLLENRLQNVIDRLNNKSKDENLNFWTFVFSSIHDHPSKEYFSRLKTRIMKLTRWDNLGYKYPEILDAGYRQSVQSVLDH